jgi:toxin ParE1/3/4
MTELRILAEVAADVADAANWYDQEGYVGLGNRFEWTFYSYLEHLQEKGQTYRTVYFGFRRIFLKPFPYALYYRYHADLLVVSLVIHAARDPERVRALLQQRRP